MAPVIVPAGDFAQWGDDPVQPMAGPVPIEPPPPSITITGVGRHASDPPGPPPQMVQGQMYQGRYVIDHGGSTTTRYDVKTIQWSWPESALKGYGRWRTVNPGDPPQPGDSGGDPSGPYEVFIGDPDNSPSTSHKVLQFNLDDVTMDYTQAGDHWFVDFYWGPESVGTQTIAISATFDKVVNGMPSGTVTVSDQVTVDVVKPTGVLLVNSFGQPGVSPIRGDGFEWLQLDVQWPHPEPATTKLRLAEPHIGITFTGIVDPPLRSDNTSFGGAFTATPLTCFCSGRARAGSARSRAG